MSTNGSEGDAVPDEAGASGYRAVVERYRDEPNQCTIFPAESDESERLTTWISAREPTYVDLWVHR